MTNTEQPKIVAIWKPSGPTSHDVVAAVRRITGERRVGHAGTLDPLAEGVLVIGIGREATKRLKDIVGQEKEYIATVYLGALSTTDDAEGVITLSPSLHGSETTEAISREVVQRAVQHFIGRIEQVPPKYSAVKIGGKPAHRRVRRGEDIQLKPRTVDINTIELLRYAWPELMLRVVCGPGTYIRSLARDIGAALGVGGYLATLERTRVGPYTCDRALTLDAFKQYWSALR